MLARLLCLSLVVPVVECSGLQPFKKMDLLSNIEVPSEESVPDHSRVILCVAWICIVCVMIWSIWLESKITIDFWNASSMFKLSSSAKEGKMIRDSADQFEPRKIDRRWSSISATRKVSLNAFDAV